MLRIRAMLHRVIESRQSFSSTSSSSWLQAIGNIKGGYKEITVLIGVGGIVSAISIHKINELKSDTAAMKAELKSDANASEIRLMEGTRAMKAELKSDFQSDSLALEARLTRSGEASEARILKKIDDSFAAMKNART